MSLVRFLRLFSCGIAEDRVNSEENNGSASDLNFDTENSRALDLDQVKKELLPESPSLIANNDQEGSRVNSEKNNASSSDFNFDIENSCALDLNQVKKELLLEFPSLIADNDQEGRLADLLRLTPCKVEKEILKIGRALNLALDKNKEPLYLIEKNQCSEKLEVHDILIKIFLRPKLEELLIFCQNLTSLTSQKGLRKRDFAMFESNSLALKNLNFCGDLFLGQKFSTVPFLTGIFQDACNNEGKYSYVLAILELIILEFKVYLKASIFLHLAQEKEVESLKTKLENIFFIEEAKDSLKSKKMLFKDFFSLLQSL